MIDRDLLRRLLRHRPALVGGVVVLAVLIVALLGPWLISHGPNQVFEERFASPSWEHPLGTDSQRYDIFARMVVGAGTTLKIALAAMGLALITGSLIGALAGYVGGVTDLVVMRLVDGAMSFPSFLLAMVVVAVLGPNQHNVILAVGMVGAPMFARQLRAEVLRVVSLEYVTAARALGCGHVRVFFRHVLPNCLAPLVVLGTLGLGGAILDVAGLNFLGLGGDPYEVPEWGMILTQGWNKRPDANLQVAVAGSAIFLTVLGFNLLGDGLKDELDPRARKR